MSGSALWSFSYRCFIFEAIEEKRRTAQKIRKTCMTRAKIGEIIGAHPDTVGRWLKLTPKEIKTNQRGPTKGEGNLLPKSESDKIKRLITDKIPDQL